MYKEMTNPSRNTATRDTLFGDLPLYYWAAVNNNEIPSTLFKAVKESLDKDDRQNAIKILNNIIALPGLESRQHLQAHYFLNELGIHSPGSVRRMEL